MYIYIYIYTYIYIYYSNKSNMFQEIYIHTKHQNMGKPESAKHWKIFMSILFDESALEIKTTPIWGNVWMMEPRNLETKQMEDTTIKRNGMLSLDFISFSHRFLEFIMMFHEFWLSVPSLYLEIFSSLPHQSLHCNIHFHQFSPTCLWFLSLVTRCYAFSLTTWSFYHWHSSFLPIHSLILSWDFNQFSPPIWSSSHSVSSVFPTSWLI